MRLDSVAVRVTDRSSSHAAQNAELTFGAFCPPLPQGPASSSLFKGSATARSMGNAGFVALYLTLVCLSRFPPEDDVGENTFELILDRK